MHRPPTILALGLTTALVVAAACSKSDMPLVGTWRSTTDDSVMEFDSDGSVVNSDDHGPLFGGHYSYIDPSTIRIEFGADAAVASERTYKIAVAGDELTVTDDKGLTDTYHRVR